MDNSKGGWENLLAFAHDKDKENRKAIVLDRSNKKGSRELWILFRSINYDKKSNAWEKKPNA